MSDLNKTAIEGGSEKAGGEFSNLTVKDDKAAAAPGVAGGSRTGGERVLSPSGEILLGGNSYSILEQLRVTSAEADIYLASDASGQKLVLKYYRQGIRPKEEIAAALKSLPREFAVKVYDSGTSDAGRCYEVQEYAEYGALSDYIQAGRLPGHEFIKNFIIRMNLCLNAIHSKNIIHRDIKPANILIRKLEPIDVVLTDFGISSVSELSLHQTSLSATITYSSPESITGVISKAVDYWALGLVALEMAIGRSPFQGMDDRAVLYTIATKHVPCVEDVPGDLGRAIKGLLTRNSRKRWQFDEIKRWADGDADVPLHFESSEELAQAGAQGGERRMKPYRFGERQYESLKSLLNAMAQNWAAAVDEMKERRLGDWIGKELLDKKNFSALNRIISGGPADYDDKFFDFLCEALDEFEFIYMGVSVTHEWLLKNALDIVNNRAGIEEKLVFLKLIDGGIIRKYYMSGRGNGGPAYYDDKYKKTVEAAEEFKSERDDLKRTQFYAQAVLLCHSEQYRKILAGRLKNFLDENVLIEPLYGFKDVDAACARASEIINKNEYSIREIIIFTSPPDGSYKSRAAINERFNGVRKKYGVARAENKIPARLSLVTWKGVTDLSVLKIRYDHKFYEELVEFEKRLDNYLAECRGVAEPAALPGGETLDYLNLLVIIALLAAINYSIYLAVLLPAAHIYHAFYFSKLRNARFDCAVTYAAIASGACAGALILNFFKNLDVRSAFVLANVFGGAVCAGAWLIIKSAFGQNGAESVRAARPASANEYTQLKDSGNLVIQFFQCFSLLTEYLIESIRLVFIMLSVTLPLLYLPLMMNYPLHMVMQEFLMTMVPLWVITYVVTNGMRARIGMMNFAMCVMFGCFFGISIFYRVYYFNNGVSQSYWPWFIFIHSWKGLLSACASGAIAAAYSNYMYMNELMLRKIS